MDELQNILSALYTIRLNAIVEEFEIHDSIIEAFKEKNICFQHEHKLGKGRRVDFFCDGIVIEVKKLRPQKDRLLKQIQRYLDVPGVTAVIIVLQKSINIKKMIQGKPVYIVSLNRNWGVAI
jgi:hypothetical protein